MLDEDNLHPDYESELDHMNKWLRELQAILDEIYAI